MHHRPPDYDGHRDKAARWLSCKDAALNENVRIADGHSPSYEMEIESCLNHSVLSIRSYQAKHD